MNEKQYQVPTLFLRDHLNRCDDCSNNPIKVIKWGKLLATVSLDDSTYADLLSDAEYYCDSFDREAEPEAYRLAPSAKATVTRLKKEDK